MFLPCVLFTSTTKNLKQTKCHVTSMVNVFCYNVYPHGIKFFCFFYYDKETFKMRN